MDEAAPFKVSRGLTLANGVQAMITTYQGEQYHGVVAFTDGPRSLHLLLTPGQFAALCGYGEGDMAHTVTAYDAVFFDLGHFCWSKVAPLIKDYEAIAALSREVRP